jgi:predicted permease
MALPLALIGVGGSLDLNSIGKQAPQKFITVGLKLVACPILLVPLVKVCNCL